MALQDTVGKSQTVVSDRVSLAIAPILGAAFTDASSGADRELDRNNDSLGVHAAGGVWALAYAAELADVIASNAALNDVAHATQASFWGTLAATEVTRAASAGSEFSAALAFAAIGVVAMSRWHTSQDARVCPICAPLNGASKNTWQMKFPTGPPAHPNCRCWIDYALA